MPMTTSQLFIVFLGSGAAAGLAVDQDGPEIFKALPSQRAEHSLNATVVSACPVPTCGRRRRCAIATGQRHRVLRFHLPEILDVETADAALRDIHLGGEALDLIVHDLQIEACRGCRSLRRGKCTASSRSMADRHRLQVAVGEMLEQAAIRCAALRRLRRRGWRGGGGGGGSGSNKAHRRGGDEQINGQYERACAYLLGVSGASRWPAGSGAGVEQARFREIVADQLQTDRQAGRKPQGIDMPGRPARLTAMV